MQLESTNLLGNAKTACGAEHKTERVLRDLNGSIVRIEGKVKLKSNDKEVSAMWTKNGRLVELDGSLKPTLKDEFDYSLCIISEN